MTVTTRAGKGSVLTHAEMDANLTGLDTAIGTAATTTTTNISAASVNDRARANHTGTDPASSVVFASGQTLESWKASVDSILAGVSASAPVNTVAPTAPTGTLSVESTLTANQGTWTGASTYAYQWRQGGVAIVGATSSTYKLRSSDTGLYITCTVTATASNGLSNAATSPAVGPVTATLPTNAGGANLPAVTPSGTQAVGTLLTSTTGTWADSTSAVYTYQWYFNGAVITNATLSTYTPIAGQEGGSVYCRVVATTLQGSSAQAQSNTITTSATPSVVNTAVPAWSGTVYLTTQNLFTPATWTGSINTARAWAFFRNSETTAYATTTTAAHTPASPVIVGDTIYIEETVTSSVNGQSFTARSTGAVVAAVPATLAAAQAVTNISWTNGTVITSVTPVTATGGTTPYSFAIKGGTTALPSGLSMNASTGAITGTPTVTVAQTTYTVQVTDAVAATAEATFIATTSAATAYPIGPQTVTASSAGIGTRYAAVGASNALCTLANPGSLRQALEGAVAGDVVFLRGGTYNMQTIGGSDYNLSANGTSSSRITVESYPGEWAVIDGMATAWRTPADRSLYFTGSYWTWRLLEIKRQTAYYGLYVGGNNNIFQGVHFLSNLGSGALVEGNNNTFTSCRFNDNSSVGISQLNFGGDTDGIGDRGDNNIIEYCEALRNSDDGFDTYYGLNSIVRYCVAAYQGLGSGNGTGFKLGGAGALPTYGNPDFHHCIAFSNLNRGFDISSAPSAEIRYCTAWSNGTHGFSNMSDTLVNNCIALSNTSGPINNFQAPSPASNISNNSWASPFGNAPTFISVTYGNINFLRPTVGGGYEAIGAFA